MKKKRTVIYIILGICFIALIIILPRILDLLIFGNAIPSNISNESWAAFLGGYIGAILTGAITLIGIVITIRFTAAQNKRDKQLEISPYLTVSFSKFAQLTKAEKELDDILYSVTQDETDTTDLFGIVYIKNIGLGPIVECIVCNARYNGKLFPRAYKIVDGENIDKGETLGITIGVFGLKNEIDNLEFIEDERTHRLEPNLARIRMNNDELSFTLLFSDLIGTKYQQTVKLTISNGITGKDKAWKYNHELTLTEVSKRELLQ